MSGETVSSADVYFALGDSLTAGTGAADGQGFVPLLHRTLERKVGRDIELRTSGIVGARSDEIWHKLSCDRNQQQWIRQAKIISITAGGNDLMQAAVPFYTEGKSSHLTQALRTFVASLKQMIAFIHALKQSSSDPYLLLVIGLYNPLPYIPIAGQWVRKFNKYTYLNARNQAVYVNVYDAFIGQELQFLSEDLFHPNEKGYAAIAKEAYQAIPPIALRSLFFAGIR